MSILDTFYILYKSESKELEKGNERARKSGESVADEMNRVDKVSRDAGKGFLRMASSAAAALGSVIAVSSLVSGTLRQMADTESLRVQAESLQMNIGLLDAMGRAFERQGSSAGSFSAALAGINKDAQNLAFTGQSSLLPVLGRLGVQMLKAGGAARTMEEMLPEIADALASMDEGQALAAGRALGFDDAAIRALMQGSRAVDELTKKQMALGVRTEEDAEKARQYAQAMTDLRQIMTNAAGSMASVIVPALEWVRDAFAGVSSHLKENAPFYKMFFQLMAAGVATVAGVVMASYVPAMIAAAIATNATIWPLTLLMIILAAAAAAIALLWDDYQTFISGGDSLIGRLIDKWKGFVSTIKDGWNALKRMVGLSADEATQTLVTEANAQISAADSSPLNSVTSSAITNNAMQRNKTMRVDKIEIQTQATDAEGISRQIGRSLEEEYNKTIDQFDDGFLA